MEFQVRDNSREGWQSVWKQLQGAMEFIMTDMDIAEITDEDYNKYVKCSFFVTLNNEFDVTNLRYYLPLYSFLKRKHMVPILHLTGEKGYLERARQFLGVMINYEGMLVAFGNIERTQREMIYKAYIEQDHSLREIDKDCIFCVLSMMSKAKHADRQLDYSLTCPSSYNHMIRRKSLINIDTLLQAIYKTSNAKPKSTEQVKLKIWDFYRIDASDILPLLPLSPNNTYSKTILTFLIYTYKQASVYKGYKRDKIEMRGDRAETSDFPLYLNTVAGGLDCRNQTIGGFSFVVKINTVPVIKIIG